MKEVQLLFAHIVRHFRAAQIVRYGREGKLRTQVGLTAGKGSRDV
jgi:hypothetical protein